MDKFQALDAFWNSFGVNAYDENTVPENAAYPYITYEGGFAGLDEKILLSASLWDRSTSWESVSKKAEEISDSIGGGTSVRFDTGRLWITKESPFAQRMNEPEDALVRRIVFQVSAEFQ